MEINTQSTKLICDVSSLPQIVAAIAIMLSTASITIAQTVDAKLMTDKPQVNVKVLVRDIGGRIPREIGLWY